MKDVSHLIANLSPEKRAALLQRLRTEKNGNNSAVKEEEYIPEEGDNYYCSMEKPGNFNSLILKKIELVPPLPDQVQIKLKCASLNFRDIMIGMDMYFNAAGVPPTMGSDYSGVISEVGKNVKDLKVGDEVFFFSSGNFAAYQNVSPQQVVKKPENMSWETAASLPTVFLTSYFGFRYIANVQPGQRVLIHTATGGVGLSAIQVAKWLDAEIYVTAGTEKKRDYLKSIGFSQPMNSRTLDFADEIMERTNGEGVDVVLNTIAGEATNKGLEILRHYGHFIQVDMKDIAKNNPLPLGEFKKGLSYSCINLGILPDKTIDYLKEVAQHYESGIFQPLVYNNYNISELGQALTYLSKSEHIGKIILEYTI